MSTKRRRVSIFPPRISSRPFLVEFLGTVAALAGGVAILNALIAITREIASGAGPDFGHRLLEIPGVLSAFPALSVGYAVWKERAWGRPALVLFLLLNILIMGLLESASVASLAGAVLGLAFISGYLYLWPNTANYYRRLRESGDSGGKPPNPGLPADA